MTFMPRMSACKLQTAAVQAAVHVPWCVCTEVASCRSSCPPEAASSASPPAAPWTVLRLLSALQKHKRDTQKSYHYYQDSKQSRRCTVGSLWETRTFLVHCICTFAHFLYVVSIALHVGEDSGLIRPHKIFGAKEMHGELSHVVFHPQDVTGDIFGQTDLSRPPSERARSGFMDADTVH